MQHKTKIFPQEHNTSQMVHEIKSEKKKKPKANPPVNKTQ